VTLIPLTSIIPIDFMACQRSSHPTPRSLFDIATPCRLSFISLCPTLLCFPTNPITYRSQHLSEIGVLPIFCLTGSKCPFTWNSGFLVVLFLIFPTPSLGHIPYFSLHLWFLIRRLIGFFLFPPFAATAPPFHKNVAPVWVPFVLI